MTRLLVVVVYGIPVPRTVEDGSLCCVVAGMWVRFRAMCSFQVRRGIGGEGMGDGECCLYVAASMYVVAVVAHQADA